MIVLIGESASGKSTLEKIISEKYGYNKIVSHTTRPIRKSGEVDGKDYHFVSEKQFEILKLNNAFAEATKYREWHYGILKENCKNDNSVVVVEPTGYRQMLKHEGINPISFHICVDIRERLVRLIERGDDLDECYRRIYSDQGAFNGVEDIVNFSVANGKKFDVEVVAEYIVEEYERIRTT